MGSEQLKSAREKQRRNTLLVCQAGIIAALYVALTYVFAPISFGAVQVRIAEALTILPILTPAAIPGVTIGCLLGNILGGGIPMDIIFGTLATLIGAVCTYLLRKKHPVFGAIPPIVSNTLIVPFVIKFAYGDTMALPLIMLSVCAGEIISCGVIGVPFALALKRSGALVHGKKKEKED